MIIKIPRSIKSDYQGYRDLISIYYQIKDIRDTKISIDFKNNRWFEANLFAVLGAILFSENRDSNIYSFLNVNQALHNVLERNGFFNGGTTREAAKASFSTVVSYNKFSPQGGKEFAQYIKNELLSKIDFPLLSKWAETKIIQSIFELFENAITHGECNFIYTCGQYFPRKNPPRMDITIVDMGVTIKKNVNNYLNSNLSGSQTIKWAVEYGNTTKTGDNPGGLGLSVIQNFIKQNNGKIQITSSDGYWEFKRGLINTQLFDKPFFGTIANIEFNLNDNKIYVAKEEIDLDNIF